MAFYSLAENPSIYDIDDDDFHGYRGGITTLRGIGNRSSQSEDSSSGSDSESSDSRESGKISTKPPPVPQGHDSLREVRMQESSLRSALSSSDSTARVSPDSAQPETAVPKSSTAPISG